MKIIDNIKDFHKIKAGYTVSLGCNQMETPILKEILTVHYDKKHIVLNDKVQTTENNTIQDVFVCKGVIDYIFPCSIKDVHKNFPEYFI